MYSDSPRRRPHTSTSTAHADTVPTSTSRHFHGLNYLLVVLLLGANIPTALYSLYRHEFGFTPLVQTLIFAVYVAGLLPSLLFFGPLSDKLGRRFVLLAAISFSLLGALVLAFADSTIWLFFGRIAQGIAVGACSAAGSAALIEHEPARNLRRAGLAATLTTALGASLGPLFGGAVAQYLPHALVLPYVLFALTLLPALIMVLLLPAPTGGQSRPTQLFQVPHVPAPIRQVFWLSSLGVALAWGAVGLFQSVVPTWIIGLLGVSNLVVAGGAAALVMICSVTAQLVANRLGTVLCRTLGIGAVGAGMIGLLVVDFVPSLVLLCVVTVIVGVGHGLSFAGAMRAVGAAAAEHAPDAQGGTLAAFFTVGYVGLAVPSICAGIAITVQGMHVAIIELAIIGAVLCGVLAVLSVRTKGRDHAVLPLTQ
ncbi:MFS transporter [Rhodococcus sp. JVH1]|uniref:MFS transporter n=1 Tax=Rhodococcus sp. JVH1 TaxID=745408 RepID=UPI00027208AA|nr:MFS transporter [Rhodococcus sp. JVH1]EJI97646.1 major Facilitator Superfamily protein [Rhodococcus sp. JVH1]